MDSTGLGEYQPKSNGQGADVDLSEHAQPVSAIHDFVQKCTTMVSELYQHYRPATAGGLFANSRNLVINGGQFTTQSASKYDDNGFELLQKHVSTAAIYNTLQNPTQLTCHSRTRKSVLSDIFSWVNNTGRRNTWILWLKGAAGCGKTTISRSLVRLCEENGIPAVAYFFDRTDQSCNPMVTVVSTIAYQIIQLIPEAKILITQAINSNPLIFDQSFEVQLEMLVINPLKQIYGQASGTPSRLLLLLDGLDECTNEKDSQVLLIRAVARYLATQSPLIIVLISSREERHLTMAFNSPAIDSVLLRLSLDNKYAPDRDIRRYLIDSFNEIKKTHPAKRHINQCWPALSQIDDILSQSSGQFIYASVVLKFVSCPYSYPPDQLEAILQGRNDQYGSLTPFEELDKLFFHIFSQVDRNTMGLSIRILECVILENIASASKISSLLHISTTAIYTALAGLASLIKLRDNHIVFLHASLPEFLLDRSRSKQYCISMVKNHDRSTLKRHREGKDHRSGSQDSARKRKRYAWYPEKSIFSESNLDLEPHQELGSNVVATKLRPMGKRHIRPQGSVGLGDGKPQGYLLFVTVPRQRN